MMKKFFRIRACSAIEGIWRIPQVENKNLTFRPSRVIDRLPQKERSLLDGK